MDEFFPPGPAKHLLLGDAPRFRDDPFGFLVESAAEFGDMVHFRFGPSHAYLLSNPDHIHYVLATGAHKFDSEWKFKRALDSMMGHDLFSPKPTPGHQDEALRLTLSAEQVHAFDCLIVEYTQAMLENWHDGDLCYLDDELRALALRITARVMFGHHTTDEVAKIAAVLPDFPQLAERQFRSPLGLNRKRSAGQEANDRVMRLVDWACAAGENKNDNLVTLLLPKVWERRGGSGALSQALTAVCDEAVLLFADIYEGAAHTLAWAWYSLSQNPEAEARLVQELHSVLGGRVPTAADLDQLPYTQMVVKETLRLYPPTWIISRQAKSEVAIGKFYVPNGSALYISPYIVHRNARSFACPDRFVPERFADGFERQLQRCAYLPFGVETGSGGTFVEMETALVLATAMQRYRVEIQPEQPVTPEAQVTLRPKPGIQVCLLERERTAAAG